MTIPDDKVDVIIKCLSEISIKRIVQIIYIISAGLVIGLVLGLVLN